MPGNREKIGVEAAFERLKKAAGCKTNTDLGRVLGISQASVSQAKAKGRIPADWFLTISSKYDVSIDWLVYGVGPRHRGQAAELEARVRQLERENEDLRSQLLEKGIEPERDLIVPVVSLAECGLKGWERRSPTSMWAAAPPDIAKAEEGFAVVAVGHSMAPAGIMPGHILFCDPKQEPVIGDVVFVEQDDGRATVKLFSGRSSRQGGRFIILEGWLPKQDGPPQPFTLEVRESVVKVLAPVIYIKRRL